MNNKTNQEQSFVTIKWSIDDLRAALKKNGISEDVIEKEPEKVKLMARAFKEIMVFNSWEILNDMVTMEFEKR